ncbi:hypothetical protein Adt_24288 [Abeliophyllum distichum]|uniref:Uncharacterized protein n=1 Tax=Abeliophyllum distichum TaxID=126358 RepID=A0ABD1SDB4_9LAMI
MQPIRNNTKYFTRLVENQVRFTVPTSYPSWIDVPEEYRARLRSIIKERSTKNKANRDKAKYSSVQGSKSLSATHYDEVASSGASLDEHAIAKEVLEKRRGHVHGGGWVPKGTSLSLDLTVASKAPQETSYQFSGDPQNDDPRFAMYEAYLRRMA